MADSQVTLLHNRPTLLVGYPSEQVERVQAMLEQAGVRLRLEMRATGWKRLGEQIGVIGESAEGAEMIPADLVLIAAGIRPLPRRAGRLHL